MSACKDDDSKFLSSSSCPHVTILNQVAFKIHRTNRDGRGGGGDNELREHETIGCEDSTERQGYRDMTSCTRRIGLVLALSLAGSAAFAPDKVSSRSTNPFVDTSLRTFLQGERLPRTTKTRAYTDRRKTRLGAVSDNDNNDNATCWNPKLRKTLGAIASIGVVETGYLTWTKLATGGQTFCGSDCSSVLNGPYATIPGLGVPLATVGLLAYCTAAFLALGPVLSGATDNDDDNRLWLTAVTTTMGVFSVFLMTLLFGVLHENCPFCVLSAVLSISLAKLSWLGGVPPGDQIKKGIQYSLGGGLAAVLGALVLFLGAPDDESTVNYAGTLVGNDSASSTLLASSAASTKEPPPILSSSSPRALQLSTDLAALDAKMYGAYWCSHCYEQKERLGKEAMQRIPYIECSRDGTNSQTSLCKDKSIPGYPTWEINGKLFPGEQEIDELADIVVQQAK